MDPLSVTRTDLSYRPKLNKNMYNIWSLYGIYNERLKEVKYPDLYEVVNVVTELCEVIAQGTCIIKKHV